MVRLRQALDQVRHRLGFIPLIAVALAIVGAQAMLAVDSSLDESGLPRFLETTVGSGRAILTAIAGGLISSVTLLLSLTLVAVQLASSQFSPRTLRNWIGDRTQQYAIGIVLGTTVFCLLVLRETKDFESGDADALTPHLSVIVAVVFGIISLMAVVRSVDHLTDRLRIGSVAASIMNDTVALIESDAATGSDDPDVTPAARPTMAEQEVERPLDAEPVGAPHAGWVQWIDADEILRALPAHSTIHVTTSVGSFVLPHEPIAWMWPPSDPDTHDLIRRAFAFGDTRTMQQDIGFGIVQMVDIALRAISPGVNDPNTANDLIVHLGAVLLSLWERPIGANAREENGRTLLRSELSHADYLEAAIDPIRLYGSGDPSVASTIIRTLDTLRVEAARRSLPGPIAPIDAAIQRVLDGVERADLLEYDKQRVQGLVADLSASRSESSVSLADNSLES